MLSPVWGDHLGHRDSAPAPHPAVQELSEQRAGDRRLSHRGVSLPSGCLTTWQGDGQDQVSSPTSQVSSRSCRPGLPAGWGRWGARATERTCRFPGKQMWWPLRCWDAADRAAPIAPAPVAASPDRLSSADCDQHRESSLGCCALYFKYISSFLSPVILPTAPGRPGSSKRCCPLFHWCSCLTCSPRIPGSWYGDCPMDVR